MSQELSFRTLLHRCVRLCSLNPETLDRELAHSFTSWLEQRVEEAWLHTIWPQTCRIEARTIAFPGDADGEDITVDSEDVDASEEGVTTDQETYAADEPYAIDFTSGEEGIGEVLNVWREDPRLYDAARPLKFWVTADTVYVPHDSPREVFIRFRRRTPLYTLTEFAEETAYAVGEVFYYPTNGECYRVKAETTAGQRPEYFDKFIPQRVPEVVARFAALAGRADYLMDDGQDDKGNAQLNRAQKFLNDRMGDVTVLQLQKQSYSAAA